MKPAGSGLPSLDEPLQAPKTGLQRFFMTVVVYVLSQRTSRHVSQRELQVILNRASRDQIKSLLHELRVAGFLKRLGTRKQAAHADKYAIGNKVSRPDKVRWKVLATTIFGREGICKGLFGRPAFGTRFLGPNGMLVLGALRRARGALTVRELHRYLAFFVGSEQTIRERLKVMERHGLVTRDGPKWTTSPDLMSRLTVYEDSFGASSRKTRTVHRHIAERELQSIRLSKGVLTIAQKAELRLKGCIRCRCSNEECIRREGEQLTIEHFPPQRLLEHWGLKDHPHFNWVICPSENSFYGGHLAHISIPDLPDVLRMTIRRTSDARAIAIAKLEVELRRYYRHIDSGQTAAAVQSVTKAASVWRALLLEVERAELKNLTGQRIAVSKKHAKQMRSGSRQRHQSTRKQKR